LIKVWEFGTGILRKIFVESEFLNNKSFFLENPASIAPKRRQLLSIVLEENKTDFLRIHFAGATSPATSWGR
jgi:hypothetical protein